MKLLLINPKFPESFWSFSWALQSVLRDKRAVNPPLGLTTIAALTPQDWEITIMDENVESIDWSFDADIVGVCGMGVQMPRQKEIIEKFRKRGIYTVAGGSYASLCPEEYEGFVDTVISGEAENIWPQFCIDFQNHQPKKLYHETETVDITTSPVPRYDLLNLKHYQKVSLQYSRGCPFQCEFCDIIVMFGRKPRQKTTEQVGQELDLLRNLGVSSVFFVDDNLIGNRAKAKELLTFLEGYQKENDHCFSFGTEASLNMASDKTLMELFQRAHFEWVFIGLETPSADSLKETKKTQNLKQDMLSSLKEIYSYGIEIYAGFIVGFDSDKKDIFELQYQFILNSGITVAMVGLLNALPKTPLFERLQKANRLREVSSSDNTSLSTNVNPIQMSYQDLIAGYKNLIQRLVSNKNIYVRISNKLSYLKSFSPQNYMSFKQKLSYAKNLLIFGILPGGPKRWYYFLRSLFLLIPYPKALPVIITDWITVLSLKSFIDRHAIEFDLEIIGERKSIKALSRLIRQSLRGTKQSITIDLLKLKGKSLAQIEILLKKLRRYHEQIHIRLSDELRQHLQKELALFSYTLVS